MLATQGQSLHHHLFDSESSSAGRKDERPPFATAWMDLEVIVRSDIAEVRKSREPCDLTHMRDIKPKATDERDKRISKN